MAPSADVALQRDHVKLVFEGNTPEHTDMPKDAICGKLSVSMDLPKYLHAVIFDERAFIETKNQKDRISIHISGSARSVNITMNHRALATLITLLADVLKDGSIRESEQKATLKEAIGKLADSVQEL